MVALPGTRTNFAGAPAVTVNTAVALTSPAAVTVMVALPVVVAVKLEDAIPAVGVTGDVGLKLPETPLTKKAIGVLAVLTVLPLASWIVAV